jgi:hypothetical protein
MTAENPKIASAQGLAAGSGAACDADGLSRRGRGDPRPPSAAERLHARMAGLAFRRIETSAEAVERVRRIRDGGPI